MHTSVRWKKKTKLGDTYVLKTLNPIRSGGTNYPPFPKVFSKQLPMENLHVNTKVKEKKIRFTPQMTKTDEVFSKYIVTIDENCHPHVEQHIPKI